VFEGAAELRLVAAMPAVATITSASAVTVITRGLAIAACRNRGCQGIRSMLALLS
jgi:hypothetical protein